MSFGSLPGRGSLENWSIGTVVSPTEFLWFEQCISRTIDAYAGGTVAPSAAIVIGGAGLTIGGSAPITFTAGAGELTCDKNATFEGSTFKSYATSTFYGLTTITADGSLACDGAASFGGNVTVTGWFACNGNVTLGNASGDSIIAHGEISSDGGMTMASVFALATNGYIQKRRIRVSTNGTTIDVLSYDVAIIQNSVTSVTIANTGLSGAGIILVNPLVNDTVVSFAGGTAPYTLEGGTSVELLRDTSAPAGRGGWVIIQVSVIPSETA
jgi:hypothetical protein